MNIIKKKLVEVIEQKIARSAHVLNVRYWWNQSITEIDLHIPTMNATRWTSVQHIKIKVGEGIYRDYSLTMWDADTKTCSLIIATSHNGPGAVWARSIKRGDHITYLGIGNTSHRRYEERKTICIGDESSLAHFIALKQLMRNDNRLSGVIGFSTAKHVKEYESNIRAPFVPVQKDFELMKQWIQRESPRDQVVYIAGSYQLVTEMRRFIKSLPGFYGAIKGQGFWK